ncbi:MAG TPA: lysoplasmalogenase [Clostridia bacterium]|nr:lysoplasmalogenase [Clostridia bacterium]
MTPTLALSILFAAVSLVHLYACFTGRNKLRTVTKPMLMPLLAALYLVSAAEPHFIVAAALLFGAVGDVFLLLPDNPVWLVTGGASFGLGHILYVAAFFLYADAAKLPAYGIALILAFFIAAAAIGFTRLKPTVPQKLRGPVLFYMLILCAMGAAATVSFFVEALARRALFPLGAILFLLSDAVLAHFLFVRESERKNFAVMATYIAAQTLIAAGFIMV